MEFPRAYIQQKLDYRTNEAERKLYAFLKEYFTNAYSKILSSVQYYLFNKATVHGTDKFQVGNSIQVSSQTGSAVVNILRTGGTEAAPTQTTASTLGGMRAYGYDGTNYFTTASIEFVSTQSFTAGARGTYINFSTTPTGTASPVASGFIDSTGSWASGKASLATTATNGFLYVPSCAGVPTGVPETITGRVPVVVDSTNNKMYIYSGGAWVALN